MANSLKELMGLSAGELAAIGAQYGLTFHAGMKKRDMVQQLQASAASGWMETNQELLYNNPEDEFDQTVHFGNDRMISDAAHVAQMLTGGGFTETFHKTMSSGNPRHLDELHGYMAQLGVDVADVALHMPKANPYETPKRFGAMGSHIRNNLIGHSDIMSQISGHYSGDIMAEYQTSQGNVQDSYEHLAHMYVNQASYSSVTDYEHDVSNIAKRLASAMGPNFHEVAASSAMGAHVSYTSILPQIGDETIVGGTRYPREPLNSAGLPLGSSGSAVGDKGDYSFAASVSGMPGWHESSRAIYGEAATTLRSMAQVYRGESGLSAKAHVTSDRDMLMDAAARYGDIESARAGYENLTKRLGDDSPAATSRNLFAMLDEPHKYEEAPDTLKFAPKSNNFNKAGYLEGGHKQTGTDFLTNFEEPLSWNPARARRESKAISDFDSIPFRDVADYGNPRGQAGNETVTYHDDLVQGSPEWLAFRENYDITGSTVGSYLGNNRYTRPWKEMINKLGLNHSGGSNSFQERMFAAGHKTEDEARIRVAGDLGQAIQQTGAITNSKYPSMMYSPDGLIGDDALWEHKNPERAGYADLNAGEHPDYMDQVQLGMLVSGRSRTLFSQTVNNETRSQWIDKDPSWYDRNRDKIDSTLGRLDAGRAFIRDNPDLPPEELTKGARAAMQGEGIWKDVRQASNRGYSERAGTSDDPFARSRSSFDESAGLSSYTPNFVMPEAADDEQSGAGKMAVAVKQGILAAQDENRQRGLGSVDLGGGGGRNGGGGGSGGGGGQDADFADDYNRDEVERWFNGGGRKRRGGNPEDERTNWTTDYGYQGGAVAQGVAGGTTSSAMGGLKAAFEMTPWGRVASVAVGATSIGAEVIESQNDYYGQALDAGMSNPIEYAAQTQGLETLGLNERQASSVNQTTHSAYNTLLNGDPSAAVRIVRGTRGLITIGDIREAQGDPVALSRVIQEKGRERGWSQARIAGAMQMAGLDGMARTFQRGEYASDIAQEGVESGAGADYSGVAGLESAQADRAQLRPEYLLQRAGIEYGGGTYSAASDAMSTVRRGAQAAGGVVSDASAAWHNFIAHEESGGNPNAKSSTSSARGSMQVLDGTAADPGFGVMPAKDSSPEERARVGRDYADAMLLRYGGDYDKANAAYTEGPGAVDQLVSQYGANWLQHAPNQAKKRVAAFNDMFGSSGSLGTGAGGFTQNPVQPTQINVTIQAQVNQQSATANVSATGGQTTNQTMNMGNGAMQRR